MLLSLYLAVLDDQSKEEQFIDVYNIYKRLVYHTAYKIMGDSYLAEDVLQEVFLYVAKNFSKIHRENCHELAAYLVSCSRSRAYDMLRSSESRWKKSRTHQMMPRCRMMQQSAPITSNT